MVLGTVIPVLVKNSVFGFTDVSATTAATTGLIGMTIGAMTIGTVTDYLGRRKVMIFAVTVFSIFTLAVAFSNSIFTFGLYRFLAGLGLGGCLPTAITLVTEFARKGKASSATTTVMTGYHVGAVLTALLGLVVLGNGHGWEWMFVIGGVPRVAAGATDDQISAGVRSVPGAEGARPDPGGPRGDQHQPSRRAVQEQFRAARRSPSGPLRSWAWSWCTA